MSQCMRDGLFEIGVAQLHHKISKKFSSDTRFAQCGIFRFFETKLNYSDLQYRAISSFKASGTLRQSVPSAKPYRLRLKG